MKINLSLASFATVGALLAGCATGPGYYGPGPEVAAVDYDGWYDGYYGPIYDGYWQNDQFWWRDRADHPYRRDDASHFRRQAADGFQHIHGVGHPGGGDHSHAPG